MDISGWTVNMGQVFVTPSHFRVFEHQSPSGFTINKVRVHSHWPRSTLDTPVQWVLILSALGPTYIEFGYNEQIPLYQNIWLQILKSSVTTSTHLWRAVSFASFSLVVKWVQCTLSRTLQRVLSVTTDIKSISKMNQFDCNEYRITSKFLQNKWIAVSGTQCM